MEEFRVIVAGSRTFSDSALMRQKLDLLLKEKQETHQVIIVSGTANGADKYGEVYAALRGIQIEQYPAEWDRYGKSAGYRRNEQMAEVADALVLFWDGVSRGSKHMLDIAENKGIPVRIVLFK